MELLNEKIEKVALPFLGAMAVDLVDLHIHRYKGDLTIRILADKENGGITLNECTLLNRKISQALESQHLIFGDYTLEVSSPGIDRPLKTVKDFKRVIGREVRFFLAYPIENKIECAGIIKRIELENVVIDFQDKEVIIPMTHINKAKQLI